MTNNEKERQEEMKTWLGILTAVVVVETLAIGIYCCSELKVDSNSPSVLISALGVLVTFVVAWQIWQTIDAKNTLARMEASVKDAEKRDNQLQHLLEAFQIDNIAQAQTTFGAQYAQSVNALRSFILAGVPASYIPINNIVSRLNGILGKVEQSKDALEKERFTRVGRECDNYYRDISKAIRERVEFYREVNNTLTAINDRRRKLTHPSQS